MPDSFSGQRQRLNLDVSLRGLSWKNEDLTSVQFVLGHVDNLWMTMTPDIVSAAKSPSFWAGGDRDR